MGLPLVRRLHAVHAAIGSLWLVCPKTRFSSNSISKMTLIVLDAIKCSSQLGSIFLKFSPMCIYSCYSIPSTLRFAHSYLSSEEGVQQGDPLGSLLFCLTIHPLILQLKPKFRVFYLDDGSLGGTGEDILHDLQLIDNEAGCLGLQLNRGKSELICGASAGRDLLGYANGLRRVSIANAHLMTFRNFTFSRMESSIETWPPMGGLSLLGKHDALCLLRHSFAIPKVLYILRSAPCFSSAHLGAYDEELCSTLSEVLNISLEDDGSWLQASLPVGYGGIGVCRATQLAPSAFLASAAGSSALISCILPD